jgi:hypothetical protein
MKTAARIVYITGALTLALLLTGMHSFAVEGVPAINKKVTIQCNGREMQEVLQELSSFSGIKILYDTELSTKKVECYYKNMSADKIVSQLFREYSTGLLIDPQKDMIIVQVFGTSRYMLAAAGEEGKVLDLPFLDGMTQEELNELHAKQYELYRRQLQDEQALVAGTNISQGELRVLHEQQYENYQNRLDNPNDIVEGIGIPRGELNDLHDRQYTQYEKDLQNDSVIMPGMDVTRGELRTLHGMQYDEYQREMNDPNAIIPGIGITRAELQRLHEQQSKPTAK